MKPLATTILLMGLLLTACGGTSPQSHGGPVRDHVSFVDALRGKGLTVQIAGAVSQPFLHPQSGTSLQVSGGALAAPADLQSFEYSSEDAVQADARQITPNGNNRTAMIDWIAPPHFFTSGRLMVIYVGADPAVIRILLGLLGPQVAGK